MTNKILYVITDSGIGGSEKIISELIDKLPSQELRPVGVVILKKIRENGQEWRKKGIPVYELGMHNIPHIGQMLKLNTIIKEIKPDLVHAFLYHSVQMCRLNNIFNKSYRLITSPRVNYRFAPTWAQGLDRFLYRKNETVLTNSQGTKKYLIQKLRYKESSIQYIPNGVDHKKFRFDQSQRDLVRSEWGLKNEVLIGGIGRLHDQKGFDTLIEAAQKLRKNRIKNRFVIVGEGPEERNLKILSQKYNLDIIYPGVRSDIPAVLSALDIFVLSSRYEGMPNILLEAMSVGLPCVATGVDGVNDIADDGKNVVLVRPDDGLSLSIGIGLLLEKPQRRKELAENAIKTAENQSNSIMIHQYAENYRHILNR